MTTVAEPADSAAGPELRAADIMRRNVVTIHDDADVRDLAALLSEKRISGVPVVDADDRLVGVVSASDLVRHQLEARSEARPESEFYREPDGIEVPIPFGFRFERYDSVPVREIMTPLVIDATEDTPVGRLADLMAELRIHRVIITRYGRLVGLVSALDLLELLRSRPRRTPPPPDRAPVPNDGEDRRP